MHRSLRAISPPALRAVAHQVIGKNAGHHGLTYRHRADADAGIMTSFGYDFSLVAVKIHSLAR
jgi:hypothetical protein